jgi:hypothetical protein
VCVCVCVKIERELDYRGSQGLEIKTQIP